MEKIVERLRSKDWQQVSADMHERGYTLLTGILSETECQELIELYNNDTAYRKTISMQRYRFGAGEYRYFRYPLPELIQAVRETCYPYLAVIANKWMEILQSDLRFPSAHSTLREQCSGKGQDKPTVLILKYGPGGFNTLHQDLYGEIWFPMQLVLFLNEPGEDYSGGEFVLTEQIPRAQSKASVIQGRRGDMLLFTTNFRPAKGSRGYYRVNMKHGVSSIHSGNRHTLGIIFHDALS
ncbi:2OG-Fe(II) oxygenase [Chitinophaga rhizophila]|uniref:2OG-Fe(II) oxygenase n=1 Tax=Chitinophaga rhizophila TaxID=2866212 RepID=A0ABS7GCB7_9BACT|nr:2OG-Fe(II) oxygenase [Chitinophaga rhizophila]MBW8684976.1 2OG-Fe(II) oxygenase [Chitinophaga rhizophila]